MRAGLAVSRATILAAVCLAAGWSVAGPERALAADSAGCAMAVKPADGPVGTTFALTVAGASPGPHQLVIWHLGQPGEYRTVGASADGSGGFSYALATEPGDQGTWQSFVDDGSCGVDFRVGTPDQWCWFDAGPSQLDTKRDIAISGDNFVLGTEIRLHFSEPVIDQYVRPRRPVTDESVELLSGRAFKTVVHPVSDDVLTLTISATDGHCAATFVDAVPPAPQQPPTDSILQTDSGRDDPARPILLGSVALCGGLLWLARRRHQVLGPVN